MEAGVLFIGKRQDANRDASAGDSRKSQMCKRDRTWFNANLESDPPNGLHNSVNTRAELATYDPALHGLISRIFPTDYDGGCPPGAP